MAKPTVEDGAFVLPGDRLGVVEEFVPSGGTYESSGSIFSGLTGYVTLDKMNKRITVRPASKSPVLPTEGSIVLGTVITAQEKMATVNILKINDVLLQTPFSGLLHISSSSPRFESRMGEVCKVGDIVRAKVENITSRVPLLTTIGKALGVVQAYCSKCGEVLELKNRRLVCSVCNNIEQRKIADDYWR